jgi:formylglycine-generating enzyme required for sulfatase activity
MKATTFGGFLGTILVCAVSHAATIFTVPVGNPGNPPDDTGFGSVSYVYDIGKYEVTSAQYTEFLNGVDPSGANSLALYNSSMSSSARGGINFNGGAAIGSKYAIKPGRDNNPVVFVSWYDSIRFANWLHNGQGSGDTEIGAYTLLGGTPTPSNGNSIARSPGARWFLPSYDEWYKAAYHKNDGATGNYWDYPTSTNEYPYSEQPPGNEAPTPSNTANFYGLDGFGIEGYAVTGSPLFDDAQNYLTDVGAYTLSTSPYGTFDQGGNVAEWNETLDPFARPERRFSGGFWLPVNVDVLHACCNGTYVDPTLEVEAFGFRVAHIPEPASVTLSIASVFYLMVQRRRKFDVM